MHHGMLCGMCTLFFCCFALLLAIFLLSPALVCFPCDLVICSWSSLLPLCRAFVLCRWEDLVWYAGGTIPGACFPAPYASCRSRHCDRKHFVISFGLQKVVQLQCNTAVILTRTTWRLYRVPGVLCDGMRGLSGVIGSFL